MTLEIEATAYSGLGPGLHDVNVTGIERKAAKAGGYYYRWEFTDGQGDTATANTSEALTPGNKTGKWYSALTGRVVEVGTTYSLGDCIGRACSIFIELNPEGYPKVISVQGRSMTPKARTATAEAVANAEGTAQAAQEHAAQEDELPF